MAKKAETKLKEKVLKALRKIPKSKWTKTQQVSINGTIDIIGSLDGVYVEIELKDILGEVAPLQVYELVQTIKTGGIALVMDQDNKDELLALLKEKNFTKLKNYIDKVNNFR